MARFSVHGGPGESIYALDLSGPQVWALYRALQRVTKDKQTHFHLSAMEQGRLLEIMKAMRDTTDAVPRLGDL